MKTIVIIPAYNEEKTIGTVIDELQQKSDADIVVISDGSTDSTTTIVREKGVPLIKFDNNQGIGVAMRAGYQYAKDNNYDIAIQVDADGQHNIDNLSQLIFLIQQEKYDMVIGSRFVEKTNYTSSFFRYCGIKFFSLLLYVLHGQVVKDTTSGYRAVNRKIIKFFAEQYPRYYPEVPTLAILIANKNKICEIPVEMRKRQGGKSSIRFWNAINYFFIITFVCIKQKKILKGDE